MPHGEPNISKDIGKKRTFITKFLEGKRKKDIELPDESDASGGLFDKLRRSRDFIGNVQSEDNVLKSLREAAKKSRK